MAPLSAYDAQFDYDETMFDAGRVFFFLNDPPPPELSPLPLRDALPISQPLPQLRVSLDTAAGHERTAVIADYLGKLERASAGRVRTRLYHSGQLHKEVALPGALREIGRAHV